MGRITSRRKDGRERARRAAPISAPAATPAAPRPRRGAAPPQPTPPAARLPGVRRSAGRAARHTLRFAWTWLAALLVALSVGLAMLAFALAEGPLALPAPLVARIEAQLNRGLPSGQIRLGGIEVGLAPEQLSWLQLRDVLIRDGSGVQVARLNGVELALALPELLRGRLVPRALRLSGAQATLRRRGDGSLDLSFGGTGAVAGAWPQLLDRFDALFASGPLAQLDRIAADDLTLSLEDARSGRIWQVTGGRLQLTQDARQLRVTLEAEVFNGTEELAQVSALLRSDKHGGAARGEARFANARTGDIALQSPALAFLAALDAPLGGEVVAEVGPQGTLERLEAGLTLGAGVLNAAARPGGPSPASPQPVTTDDPAQLRLSGGDLRLAYDPALGEIDFRRLALRSDRMDLELAGRAWLRETGPDGWPRSFEGQFRLHELALDDSRLLAVPVRFDGGAAELRLRLAPLRLDVGRLQLGDGEEALTLAGRAALTAEGPDLGLELAAGRLELARALALWPPMLGGAARDWVESHVEAGTLSNLHLAFAHAPGALRNQLALGFDFEDARFRWTANSPPVVGARGYLALGNDRMAVVAEGGRLLAPQGGALQIAGSVFAIPDLRRRPMPAEVTLQASGPLPALLATLDAPPFGFLARAGLSATLAQGEVAGRAALAFPLKRGLQPHEVGWQAEAELAGLHSTQLVPGRRLDAQHLRLRAEPQEDGPHELRISGPATLDGVGFEGTFTAPLGATDPEAEAPLARVKASTSLEPQGLAALGVALPSGLLDGAAPAEVEVTLRRDAPPAWALRSELVGMRLGLSALDWSKPAATPGALELAGHLGNSPGIDRLQLQAPGLSLSGRVELDPQAGFRTASLQRVRLGGWLDAPVVLRARGPGQPLAVQVQGGTLDFRKAPTGRGGGGGTATAGPISVALERLIVAEGLDLTGFRGEFAPQGGGYSGSFTARLNGGGELLGTVVPQAGGTALRLASQNAGAVLRDSGMAERIRGGAMELRLVPTLQPGVYEGQISAERLRVRGTPALAELLNAVSVVGLLQQLNGDGIVFDRAHARFRLSPQAVDIRQASASGASLGISVEGRYTLGTGALQMQGVFSPVFLLNGVGQLFTRPGEGLFGFTYRLGGTATEPKVAVNPLSILTPGMFREIFRTAPPAN